jgi:hypothetical protein
MFNAETRQIVRLVSHLAVNLKRDLSVAKMAQEQAGGASAAPTSVPPAAGADVLPQPADLMKSGLRHVRYSALQALDYSVPLGRLNYQC